MAVPGPPTPDVQCVFVIWGEKYPIAHVNAMIEAALAHSSRRLGFTCLSDRPRPDLHPAAQLQDIGPAFARPDFMGAGTQAKLAIFEKGRLADGVPALYFDLDTMIMGDVGRLAALLKRQRGLHMIPATAGSFWPLGRAVNRVRAGTVRFRGNGSIFVFMPEDWHHLPQAYLDQRARATEPLPRHLWADDRFVSHMARDRLFAIPTTLAVKFVNEFMAPGPALARRKGHQAATTARRQGLVALTFSGDACKPEDLLQLPEGGTLSDRKGRVLVWEDEAMSGLIPRIRNYWAHMSAGKAES